MKQSELAECDSELVYRVVELLFKERGDRGARLKMEAIAGLVKEEFSQNLDLTRESLYPLVEEAVRRGFVRLTPPVSRAFRDKLVAKFPALAGAKVNVVETTGPGDNAKVAAVAADKAFAALVRIAKAKGGKPVGLGLGPGRATLEFCRFLSGRLKLLDEELQLRLVAITAGSPATMLENAPISFLNLFPEHLVERKLGLFAETLVRAGDFAGLSGHTGIKEAFAAKSDIDLIVTAMGDFNDPHDLLSVFLKDSGQDLKALRRRGWLGNVQYRPFTANGPVEEAPDELRAVTVFELADLVERAKDRTKEVILMARQCGVCGRAHAGALRALLSNTNLKVFSRLVLDRFSAVALLK
jgi:DNA-binding transcriptional regulator LsrR (DeoR family)